MILISNNLYHKDILKYVPDSVIRVNLAWIKNMDDAHKVIANIFAPVFLDYPQGRFKPPVPILTMDDAIALVTIHHQIKYFAVSNATILFDMNTLRRILRKDVKIVPKIETEEGVSTVLGICEMANTNLIMLDKDDLYMNMGRDNMQYQAVLYALRDICKKNNIRILELQGVVFKDV